MRLTLVSGTKSRGAVVVVKNAYEGMFILDPNRYGRDSTAAAKWVEDLIKEAGGEILTSRLWDERRLAYPIKGHRKGAYWLTYFRIDGVQLGDMTRQCEINDLVLRHLFMKIEPRVIDALVEHASSGAAAPPANSRNRSAGPIRTPRPNVADKKPAADKPAVADKESPSDETKESNVEKPVAEKPVAEKPVAEKPVAEKPVTEKPVAEKPVAEKPVTEKPVTEKQPTATDAAS